jgi:5'(3')-deoxyribonucleotidase
MSKPKIALDLDNTLNKLSFYFLQTLEYDYGICVGDKYEKFHDNTQYNYYELSLYSDDLKEKIIDDIFGNYNFWINIPLMNPNVPNFIEVLNTTYDLDIVTYPYKNFKGAKKGKYDWIKKNLPGIRKHQIVFKNKEKEGTEPYTIVVDDNPNILQYCKQERKKRDMLVFKYNHKYNKHVHGCDLTIDLWDDFVLYDIDDVIKRWETGDYQYIHFVEGHHELQIGWYFSNEAHSLKGNGPFKTKYDAVIAYQDYSRSLTNGFGQRV